MQFSLMQLNPLIRTGIENDLHTYMAAILKDIGSPSLAIGGTDNHVHILCALAKTATIAHVIEAVKKGSSRWIKTKGPEYGKFCWQAGYGAFSIGRSARADIVRYIDDQQEQHRETTFKDEFRTILRKYEVQYDERHVWD